MPKKAADKAWKIHSRSQAKASVREDPGGWTTAKLAVVLILGVIVMAVAGGLILTAVGWSSAWLRDLLAQQPGKAETFSKVTVPLLDTTFDMTKYGPIFIEVFANVLALMTVVLVMRRLPYGKWHRGMWMVAWYVAITNFLHISSGIGTAVALTYSVYSLLGPWLIHLYVLFVAAIRAGHSVGRAAAAVAESQWSLLVVVVKVLVRVGGAVFHPVETWRAVSAATDPSGIAAKRLELRRQERTLRLELESNLARLMITDEVRARVLGPTIKQTVVAQTVDRAGRSGTAGWWTRFKNRKAKIQETSPQQPDPPALGVHPPPADLPTSHRPETPLTGGVTNHPTGGVLTAFPDPQDRAHPGVHDALRLDPDAFARELNDTRATYLNELDALARTLRTDIAKGVHGVQNTPNERVQDPLHGGVHGVQGGVQPAERAPENGMHGERSDQRAPDRSRPVTSMNSGVHGASGAPVQPAKARSVQPGGEDGSDTGEMKRADLVVVEYWRRVHDQDPARPVGSLNDNKIEGLNVRELADALGVSRSTASRTWKACLLGTHPDPDPNYANRARTDRPERS